MKALVLAALVAASLPAVAQTWHFRVVLDGRDIGTHRFTVRERGVEREVVSEAAFRVDFFGIPAYRYRHEASERWSDDCLRSLVSRTDDNGTPHAVDWRPDDACVQSFAYWNPTILRARRLVNAQTGEIEPVVVSSLGEDRVDTFAGPVNARRYRIDARRLSIDVWYASNAEWIALETVTAGNRRLRYHLDAKS